MLSVSGQIFLSVWMLASSPQEIIVHVVQFFVGDGAILA